MNSRRDTFFYYAPSDEAVAAEKTMPKASLSSLTPSEALLHPERLVDQTVGNFRILSKIGRGGFATIYKAEQIYLQQPFAIKILHIDPKEQPEVLERFRREAQALAQLRHNHVVQIADFGLLPNVGFYLVMEFLEGQDLRHHLQEGKSFSLPRILKMMEQLCSVLDYIHRRGILHRDLKPANIFLIDDPILGEYIKLIDFGVASLIQQVGSLTQQGAYLGTARYVSPEQAEGSKDVDGRSDLYSLGVILHSLLCQKLPFDGENPIGILYQHIHKPPPLLATQKPHVAWDPLLEDALQCFLAKDREKRPPNALAFWKQCEKALLAQIQLLNKSQEKDLLTEETLSISPRRPHTDASELMRTVRNIQPLSDPRASQPPSNPSSSPSNSNPPISRTSSPIIPLIPIEETHTALTPRPAELKDFFPPSSPPSLSEEEPSDDASHETIVTPPDHPLSADPQDATLVQYHLPKSPKRTSLSKELILLLIFSSLLLFLFFYYFFF